MSILGERYTHGHVFDFYKKLRANPAELHVLGNGKQRKSYLYVQDCIDAMLLALERADGKTDIFNLGADEYCQVDDSIGWITEQLGLSPQRKYSGGERGWIGDNPFIFLDCREDPRARLEAEADHPPGRRADPGLARRESMGHGNPRVSAGMTMKKRSLIAL